MKTIKVQVFATLACPALSGGAFARAAGGGAGGGGAGGTGMSTPNSHGCTATTSNARGANTMGESGASSTTQRHRKATHPAAASSVRARLGAWGGPIFRKRYGLSRRGTGSARTAGILPGAHNRIGPAGWTRAVHDGCEVEGT
ncbi:hypothetical protein E1N52_34850 [Paraburkholderia guartelaensis]|uniref:Uncharacterized protein n=1 Tax=Paraburkholderia guartelaensis TaxID=2546446 RepID=A0A4R5L593_9BURK|nr:hypothetical protein E1N52_34850 [Paraburkholderia guartelaensis]